MAAVIGRIQTRRSYLRMEAPEWLPTPLYFDYTGWYGVGSSEYEHRWAFD